MNLSEIQRLDQDERIRALCDKAGVSLAALSRGVGVHRQTVQWWVSPPEHRREPSMENWRKIYQYLRDRIDGLQLTHVLGA